MATHQKRGVKRGRLDLSWDHENEDEPENKRQRNGGHHFSTYSVNGSSNKTKHGTAKDESNVLLSALKNQSTKSLKKNRLETTNDHVDKKISTAFSQAAKPRSSKRITPQFDEIPLDWSIKSKIVITSKHPFYWSSQLSNISISCGMNSFTRTAQIDLSRFGYSKKGSLYNNDIYLGMATNFVSTLMYSTFPTSPIPHSLQRFLQSHGYSSDRVLNPDVGYFESRIDDWLGAVHSSYSNFKNGFCPYFYLLTRESAILFVAGHIPSSCTEPRVVLSHTSHSFLKKLEAEEIEYTEKKDTPQRQTVFAGSLQVHSFYDFFVNYVVENAYSMLMPDVPTILSPVPFLNGSLKSAQTERNSTITDKNLSKLHRLEISGPLLPHVVPALAYVLKNTQKGNFSMHFEQVAPPTLYLNLAYGGPYVINGNRHMWSKDTKRGSVFQYLQNDTTTLDGTAIESISLEDYECKSKTKPIEKLVNKK
eukprot:gb/GECH01013227.1/.p1 GENE.gb/GECH01013227.1/~~gb/GECH01013227.1/.p1  ORF type:complete len:477 (+),score=105.33 gb/GECH01013227.1/:1-1431(+)